MVRNSLPPGLGHKFCEYCGRDSDVVGKLAVCKGCRKVPEHCNCIVY